jgi:hypothetical protein
MFASPCLRLTGGPILACRTAAPQNENRNDNRNENHPGRVQRTLAPRVILLYAQPPHRRTRGGGGFGKDRGEPIKCHPELTYDVININDEKIHTLKVKRSELSFK